jgi:hypothetical protein
VNHWTQRSTASKASSLRIRRRLLLTFIDLTPTPPASADPARELPEPQSQPRPYFVRATTSSNSMNHVPNIGSWPLHNTEAQLFLYGSDLDKVRMSEPNPNAPRGSPISANTVTQDPDASAPRFNAQAPPFPQPRHQSLDFPFTALATFGDGPHLASSVPLGNQSQVPSSYSYDGHYQTLPTYYPQYQYPGEYRPTTAQPSHLPRRPAFSPNRPGGERTDMPGSHGMGNSPYLPARPTLQSAPFPPTPFATTFESSPYRQQNRASLPLQPLPRYSGGYDQNSTPYYSPSADHYRQLPPAHERSFQQSSRQFGIRSHDRAERRASRSSNVQRHGPDGNASPSTSMRRNYDRFSHDLSLAYTSSNAEEAASRIPPSSRARHLPRDPELRLLSPAHRHNPNIVTSRHISEFKAKLPRVLLGDLPEGASSSCDICDKEYCSTHVVPSEDAEIAVELVCGHRFGEWCISQWVCLRVMQLPDFAKKLM